MNVSEESEEFVRRREAEHEVWSNAERDKLTSGDLASLEQAIANDSIADLRPEDRLRLIEAFVERCRRERPAPEPAPGSVVPIEGHTRLPKPLALAREPVAPGKPLPGLSFRRSAAWALALWVTATGMGALILKILAGGT